MRQREFLGMEEWLESPILQRAWELAEELEPPVITSVHLLYGLLKIAEDAGVRSGPFSSARVLYHLQNLSESEMQAVELPQKWAHSLWKSSCGRWAGLFFPGEPGWLMCRALQVDPSDFHQAIDELPDQAGRVEWMSDWKLLESILVSPEHPVAKFLADRFIDLAAALQWLKDNRRLYSRFAAVTPGEVDLLELINYFASLPEAESLHLQGWRRVAQPISEFSSRLVARMVDLYGFRDALGICVKEAGHQTVHPIHQYLTGLRQARFQLDYAFARRPVEKYLKEVVSSSEVLTEGATQVLERLTGFCQALNVEPQALHLTWAAVSVPDELLQRALREVDCERLMVAIEKDLLGQLPDAPLEVDGIALQGPGAELGPLQRVSQRGWRTQGGTTVELDDQGLVVALKGARLTSRGQGLMDNQSGYHRAEELLGLGRPNRWIPVLGAMLKVTTGQGGVETVELKL